MGLSTDSLCVDEFKPGVNLFTDVVLINKANSQLTWDYKTNKIHFGLTSFFCADLHSENVMYNGTNSMKKFENWL
jgi:hypothetical protein